jgi:carbon-monoxide dehydrogenase small subunit
MSERFHDIAVTVNGEEIRERIDARRTLVDFLRETLALTGTHIGCEHGLCGACTVRLDGEVVRGCLMLAVQCDGARVDTIEGVSDSGEIADLQTAFEKRNALQCGFCTPGMLLTAQELLRDVPCHRGKKSATTFPAIIAAAPATRRSSMRSRRWRSNGREHASEIADDNRPPSPRSTAPIPISAARCRGRTLRDSPRPRSVRERRDAAANGALSHSCARRTHTHDQGDRHRCREGHARRRRRRHWRRAFQGNHALGRRCSRT